MPDLSIDTVRGGLASTAARGNDAIKPWAGALKTSARQEPGGPAFREFRDGSPDPLKRVESMFEHAVGADPSLGGLLSALGGAMMTGIGHPIAAITDQYQANKIRDLQEKFLRDHGPILRMLGDDLSQAKLHMRQLADLMDQIDIDPSKFTRLMKEKQAAGERARQQIREALERTQDPQERKRLLAAQDEMDKWAAERDERIRAEQPAVDELHGKLDKTLDKVFEQRASMRDAGNSGGPVNVTGPDPNGGPSRVIETTHNRPDAIMHVASLHNLLLRSRAGLGEALAP